MKTMLTPDQEQFLEKPKSALHPHLVASNSSLFNRGRLILFKRSAFAFTWLGIAGLGIATMLFGRSAAGSTLGIILLFASSWAKVSANLPRSRADQTFVFFVLSDGGCKFTIALGLAFTLGRVIPLSFSAAFIAVGLGIYFLVISTSWGFGKFHAFGRGLPQHSGQGEYV